MENSQKQNNWILDYEQTLENYENKGKHFYIANQNVLEWEEQMLVSDKLVEDFIEEEYKNSNRIEQLILYDAMMVKMSSTMSKSKRKQMI